MAHLRADGIHRNIRFLYKTDRSSLRDAGSEAQMPGGFGGSALCGIPYEADTGIKTLNLMVSKTGMFFQAIIGVAQIGEALEVESVKQMKRQLVDVVNIFEKQSSWGWASYGSLHANAEDIGKQGLETFKKGDRLTISLDTDNRTLRFGINGILLERVVENIPPGCGFCVAGTNCTFKVLSFEDGALEKQRQVAAQKKAEREDQHCDEVLRLERRALQQLRDQDTEEATKTISEAILECAHAGPAGAVKAADLERIRDDAFRQASELAEKEAARALSSLHKNTDRPKARIRCIESIKKLCRAGPPSQDTAGRMVADLFDFYEDYAAEKDRQIEMLQGALRQAHDDKHDTQGRLNYLWDQVQRAKKAVLESADVLSTIGT